MSRRLREVAPTKSNLLRLRERLGFVVAGHELLDQKREILLEELVDMRREAGHLRREVEAALGAAWQALRGAILAGGHAPLEAEALAMRGSQQLRVRERSVMGVIVPLVELDMGELAQPVVAPGDGPVGAALVGRAIRELLPMLARLAEIEVSCLRLATELQKTQRRVNALASVFIPEYRDTLRFIEGALEEREREERFQMKRLKAARGAAGEEV